MKKKEIIIAIIICVALTVLDLLAFPMSLFGEIKYKDINPIYFTLIMNQWLLIILGFISIKFLCPNLDLLYNKKVFKKENKEFLFSGLIIVFLSALFFAIGLIGKYDYTPSFEKVFIEGIFYYISVAIIEELYIRGLLLNIIDRLAIKSNNHKMIAIIVSALLFGLGHIFGMIGQDALTVTCRIIWTISLGIYLGCVYMKSKNLWIPILIHMFIDFAAVSFCFLSEADYTPLIVISVAASYVAIAGFTFYNYFFKKDKLND